MNGDGAIRGTDPDSGSGRDRSHAAEGASSFSESSTAEQFEFSAGAAYRPSLAGSIIAALVGAALLIGTVLLAIFVFLPLAIVVFVLAIAIVLWTRLRLRWRDRFGDRSSGRRNVRVVDPGASGD